MAKDPAFLFYPGDWLGGTMTFSRSHKGAYMDLLMAQFNQGHLALEDVRVILNGDFESMWESKLKSKFKEDENGCFYNERLDIEYNKRKKFSASRRGNLGKKEVLLGSHMGPHMDSHMENRDENKEDKGGAGGKVFTPPTLPEVVEYFKSKGYDPLIAERAWEGYDVADWVDSQGKRIKNWKQKMIQVWFRPEFKIKVSKDQTASGNFGHRV